MNNPETSTARRAGVGVPRLVRLFLGRDEYYNGEHIAHEPALWQRSSVRRWFRLFSASIRLQWYLLTQGMWRGECAFTGWHKGSNRIGYLAATTGSIFDGTIKPVRIFWDEVSKPNETGQGHLAAASDAETKGDVTGG